MAEHSELYKLTMQHWYAVPNDMEGGWSISVNNAPASAGGVVADFTYEAIAKHIAEIHNRWLVSSAP